jgi:DNA mismatch repair protein MSH4
MMIDVGTARNLELVSNVTHKKSSHSLFGFVYLEQMPARKLNYRGRLLNHTYTAMGARLLRVTILAPSTGASLVLNILLPLT